MAELSGFAAQLGVAGPSTQRGLLELLVAAGVLVSDASDRLRVAADPPRAWDVLELPARRVEELQRSDATRKYTSLASDIVSTVAWSRHDGAYGAARFTVPELADRLLASPVEVQATLRYAVSTQLLAVDGDQLTVLAKRAPSRPHGR